MVVVVGVGVLVTPELRVAGGTLGCPLKGFIGREGHWLCANIWLTSGNRLHLALVLWSPGPQQVLVWFGSLPCRLASSIWLEDRLLTVPPP